MNMPEHQNGMVAVNYGGGFEPLTEQADVDGVTYAFGIGKDLNSGWRVGAYARFFDGEGSSSSSFPSAAVGGTNFGNLDGTLEIVSAGVPAGTRMLDVDVREYAVSVSAGHSLGDILRGDLIVSYGTTDTDYRNVVALGPLPFETDTTFSSDTVELAARLSASFPLSDDFSLNVGGSAGYGVRNVDMNARQLGVVIAPGVDVPSSAIDEGQDVNGFIGRADVSLNFNISRSTMIGLTANYVYDDMVPVYVAQVLFPIPAATAATFTTEGQSSMTYGVRLVARF
jgi:hypothetical protein